MDIEPTLVEFPADEPERARRFWSNLLGVSFEQRTDEEGSGWQTHGAGPQVGVHERGRGSGDTVSLPYFAVADLDKALERVKELGGSIIHPGSKWAICRDSEGSPFGLALTPASRRPKSFTPPNAAKPTTSIGEPMSAQRFAGAAAPPLRALVPGAPCRHQPDMQLVPSVAFALAKRMPHPAPPATGHAGESMQWRARG